MLEGRPFTLQSPDAMGVPRNGEVSLRPLLEALSPTNAMLVILAGEGSWDCGRASVCVGGMSGRSLGAHTGVRHCRAKPAALAPVAPPCARSAS